MLASTLTWQERCGLPVSVRLQVRHVLRMCMDLLSC